MLMLVRRTKFILRVYADRYLGVIQDAKFKRREALADLAKAASKK
jgi:hypothetical protein